VSFGFIGQRLSGLRWPFIIGQSLLLAAIVLFAVSRSVVLLVVARVIQGFSCGVVMTVAYPLLFDAVGSAQMGQAIGYASMSMSLGWFAGPIVGGILYDAAGFEWVFVPSAIATGLEIVMRFLLVEPVEHAKSENTSQVDPDVEHQQQDLLLPKSIPGLRLNDGHSSQESLTLFPAQSYGSISRRDFDDDDSDPSAHESPLKILLRNPRFLTSMVSLFVINSFTASYETIVPVFTYERFGFTSTQIALSFLCITVPMLVSPLSGYLCDRFGPKILVLSGFGLWAPSLACMLLADDSSKSEATQLKIFLALLLLFGISVTLTWAPVYSEVSAAVEELGEKSPETFGARNAMVLAFGLENGAFGLGAMIGPICASAIKERYGFGIMSAFLGAVSILMCIPVALYTGTDLLARLRKASCGT
jgi:MFS family permease